METLLKIVAMPLAWLVGGILRLRHFLYDAGLYKIYRPSLPVIAVGNLQLGGAGKTPMTEYLIRLLKNDYRTAVLSRGYKRRTKGFVMAGKDTTPLSLGDEPFQFYRKFGSEIVVAVDENRARGIRLLQHHVNPQVILLDDALQHRRVEAGLKVLLTPFHRPFVYDRLFPAGRLRDLKIRARNADIIVITKTPPNATAGRKKSLLSALEKYGKPVLFASIVYETPRDAAGKEIPWEIWQKEPFLLITGIADAKPLMDYLKSKNLKFSHLKFPDHHHYDKHTREHIRKQIHRLGAKRILTTEKDFVKLQEGFPAAAYVPIRFALESGDEKLLKHLIYEQIKSTKSL